MALMQNQVAGCSKRLSSKAAGESKPEAYPLGYVEDFDETRTKLADFFSIPLAERGDGDGGPAKLCRTVAGIGHLHGAASITPCDRRRSIRLDGMDKGAEGGKDCLLRANGPFMGSRVTNYTCHPIVEPISRDLSLGSHPLRSCNPPRYDSCDVHDASYTARGLGLHNRHRIRCYRRDLIQLTADGNQLLACEKGHHIQEVNPKFQERSTLTGRR